MSRATTAFALAVSLLGGTAAAQNKTLEIAIATPRVTLGDLVPALPEALRALDLGPAPAPGGSRLVTRDELKKAIADAKGIEPKTLPAQVRVVRKMRKLDAMTLESEARRAINKRGLSRGATLAAVKAPRSADVPDGFDSVRVEIGKPPRRTGSFLTTAMLVFNHGSEELARVAVPIELALGADAATPDLAKGAPVKLVVRRGLVEITASALAGVDADVGDTLQVVLKPSGKTLRARLVDREHAEALEDGS
jgi:hypothetical protein